MGSNHSAIYEILAVQYIRYWHSEAFIWYGFMQQLLLLDDNSHECTLAMPRQQVNINMLLHVNSNIYNCCNSPTHYDTDP